MADLSQFGTPAAGQAPPPQGPPPPQAPPTAGGGLSQFGTRDLSAFGTRADTPTTETEAPDSRSTGQKFKDFMKYGPETSDPALTSIRDFGEGTASSLAEIPATIGGVVHRIGGNLIRHSDPITDTFKQLADQPRDNTSKQLGGLFETIAEWMVGEGALKALTHAERMTKLAPVVKMLEKFPKISEAALAHPEVVKLLPGALRQGILGTTQTAAHGGNLEESLRSGMEAGSLGLALPMITGAARGVAAKVAEDVRPTVREIEGVPVTELASEARGPNGELTASKRAQKAAQFGSEHGLIAEREAGFKQLQTNLAKKGIGAALEDANKSMAESGVDPTIKRTQGGQWRYIPPDGSTSMSAPETQSAMNDLKNLWLDKEWTPQQEAQIKGVYNDMKEQLDRHGRYDAAQPVVAHDVGKIVDSTGSYRDAADHLQRSAQQGFNEVSGSARQKYTSLLEEKARLQDDFDMAKLDPNKRQIIMEKIDDVHNQMDALIKTPEMGAALDSPGAMRPFKQMRLANAFNQLQNVMDQHFNLRADTAAKLGRARTATKLKSLSEHIEKIKGQYGDVLDPVLGKDGLDHITEFGDMLNQPRFKEAAPKTYIEHVAHVLSKHFGGQRGALKGGAMVYGLNQLGHLALGAKGGAAVLGVEAMYRKVVNRMATDPEFAAKIIDAAKTNKNPKLVGQVLASGMMFENNSQNKGEATDETSE